MTMERGNPSLMLLPLFVVREHVLCPGGLLRLSVGRPGSVQLVESLLGKREELNFAGVDSVGGGSTILLAIFTQRVGLVEGAGTGEVAVNEQRSGDNSGSDGKGAGVKSDSKKEKILKGMNRVGCAAKVVQMGRVAGGESFKYSVLVQGVSRIRVVDLSTEGPMLHGTVLRLFDEGSIDDPEVKALSINLREAAQALLNVLKSRSHPRSMNAREIMDAISSASPAMVADVLASSLNVSTAQKQAVLEETSLERRMRHVLELVREQAHVLSIASKIHSEVEGKLHNRQREFYLRQQLKAIRSELGEEGVSSDEDEMAALESRLEAAELPPEARKLATRDFARLKKMQPSQPEYTVVRTYLETVAELPWNRVTQETYDIRRAQMQLDKDHYGLHKVKQRIVEYIAVRSLMSDSKGSILCLVGPPGVGKTSLGRSIASALNRKFQRLSLGGVHDEAEIRGHRRTYIGAMHGGIIRCLRRADVRNPVLLLDEVDKIGSNVRGGDPSAALLEVLDPEQNDTFTDHYLNVPFDLSSVLFVATANKVDTIPEALLDRLEVINIPGYTLEEKVQIAEAYLIPKKMAENGLGAEHMMLPRSTVLRVASSYTREAGVRQLERELAALCRHVALKVGVWQQDLAAKAADNHHRESSKSADIAGGQSASSFSTRDSEALRSKNDLVPQVSQAGASENAGKVGTKSGRREELVSRQQQQQQRRRQQEQEKPGFARIVVTCEMLRSVLGPELYESEVAARVAVPGMSTGLAWTPTGGELLFIECASMPGCGNVKLTGKLGEVMQESAQIALSWIRSREHEICTQLGIGNGPVSATSAPAAAAAAAVADAGPASAVGRTRDRQGRGELLFSPDFFSETDLHVHVPAGAVSKDGPSAGVAIASAILSLLMGRAIDTAVAMTGEITLRGLVLPVGGVREKVLAARRGGIRRVLLPARNRGDLDELAPDATEGMRFTLVENLGDVLFALFPGSGDGVDVAPGASPPEASGDEAGGVGSRRAGFHPVHGHASAPRAVATGLRMGKERAPSREIVGACEAEGVSTTLLESFL